MKSPTLLLAVFVLVLASCTTAYKTGQTPDDVYYSAAKPQKETEDRYEKEEEKEYAYDERYYDDRYLRMKVRNRYRWNDLDDWYFTDRYSIGYNSYYGTFNNPFNRWNYYYNPFCCCLNNYNYVFVNPKSPATPPAVKRPFTIASYANTAYNNNNNGGMLKTSPKITTTKPVYNNNNIRASNSLSDKVRTIFNNENSGSRPSRTYNPSSSSSSSNNNGGSRSSSSGSSGSSGGSGGGGVSRPTRN